MSREVTKEMLTKAKPERYDRQMAKLKKDADCGHSAMRQRQDKG